MEIQRNIILGYLSCIFGSISFLSTLTVFAIYIFNSSLRGFTYRIIVYMQISDCILSFAIILLGIEQFHPVIPESYCYAQGFLLNLGIFTSNLWVLTVTLVMLKSIKTPSDLHFLKKIEKKCILFCFGLPIILSIV